MIANVIDFVRRRFQQALSVGGNESPKSSDLPATDLSAEDVRWCENFLSLLMAPGSRSHPRALVQCARSGFPNALRGWAWCQILRVDLVPRTFLPIMSAP